MYLGVVFGGRIMDIIQQPMRKLMELSLEQEQLLLT